MQRFYFLTILLLPFLVQAQPGCTDSMATNFDIDAQENDGSCQYPVTNISTEILNNLPDELPECSGMVGYEDYWITINDSGGGNDLILLDKNSGDFIREVEVLGATNVDWESLTIYDGDLYIGDTGNNNGNRTNLRIYKVSLADLDQNEVQSSFFPYSYENQIDFDPEPEAHPFDCEGIIVNEEGIHLFTKGWDFGLIGHYLIDLSAASDIAVKIDEILVNGLVTGAHIDQNGTLGFTGTDGNAFLWLFYDYQAGDFFSGNKRKIGIGFLGQNESLFLDENQTAWITSEDTFQPGKIFFLNYGSYIVSGAKNILALKTHELYPNPFSSYFQINWNKNQAATFQISSISGEMVKEGSLQYGENKIDLLVPNGLYLITMINDEGIERSFVVKQ